MTDSPSRPKSEHSKGDCLLGVGNLTDSVCELCDPDDDGYDNWLEEQERATRMESTDND